jgi:5-methylthioadenosine/S-adenosylhomocysteine deaminase
MLVMCSLNAYLAGTPAPLAEPSVAEQAKAVDAGGGDTATAPSRAAPMETIALGGQLLTSSGPIRGWLTIEAGLITDITTRKPGGARTLSTDGVILPGLIDVHWHPEFNVFAPWEPPRTFVNRYAWRDSDEYANLIREPQNRLLTSLRSGTQLRYAEIRALVGGATAIQGASGRTQGADEFLVRNVDQDLR